MRIWVIKPGIFRCRSTFRPAGREGRGNIPADQTLEVA